VTGIELRVEHRQLLRACSAGLSEKTALVDVSVHGEIPGNVLEDNRLRVVAAGLYPAEPLFGITQQDWPSAFLMPGDDHAGAETLRHLGNWVVALTVAIQRWGGDPVFRGRVCDVAPGRLRLAIPWFRPPLFDEALSLALQFVPQWMYSGQPDHTADPSLDQLFDGRLADIQALGLGAVTLRFVDAAVRRHMPFDVQPSFVQIGWGANAERFDWAATGRTSWMAMGIARNKYTSIETMAEANLPTPWTWIARDADEAQRAADAIGWPVVVKPFDLDGGVGVTVCIRDADGLRRAFEQAERLTPGRVLVQQQIPGDDHRLLVARGEVLQVALRKAAHVIGDGMRSVGELVNELNSDPRRGTQWYSILKFVDISADDVREHLAEQGFWPDSVPPAGASVWLNRIPNISAGGTAEDVTGIAHPDNIALAVRAARIVGLDIAGVDFICPDISRSWRDVGGAICEVNGQPGFRPQWLSDPDRDINGEVLDILFNGRPARIPTAAITGTNGKTTTSEMLYRIWTEAGRLTGVCTTALVRIGEQIVSNDNLSGQPGARIILNDPAVQAAVLEMPRKGLIIFGHHCDRYDVAALLNVQDDHIGVDGIDTIEQMAELKAEVLERATEAIVVNAEDPLCLAMRARAGTARHILVSRTPDVDAVVAHRRQGGEAVFLDDRGGRPWIILATGASDTALMPIHDIPATLNGLLAYNEINALFAAGVAWAQGVDNGTIRRALGTFDNSAEQNPGRYNFFDGLPFEVLVDFAHNPDGVRGVCSVACALPVDGRRLLCTLNIGNRHSAHFEEVASLLASSFDEFVLGSDPVEVPGCPEYAGDDPVAAMVARSRTLLLEQGVRPDQMTCEVDRLAAIRTAFDRARPGDLVVLLADYTEARRVVDEWRVQTGARRAEAHNG
jgi:cyanophycin synthetase